MITSGQKHKSGLSLSKLGHVNTYTRGSQDSESLDNVSWVT